MNTHRLLVALNKKVSTPLKTSELAPSSQNAFVVETVLFKEVDAVRIRADVFLPRVAPREPMPIGRATDAWFVTC